MSKRSNGKAETGTGTNDQRNGKNAASGLGSSEHQSQNSGSDSNSVPQANSTWRNSIRQGSTLGNREGGTGGIIRQLRELRDEHLAFVDAHSERLKARLADDEKHRQHIIDKMNRLERQIMEKLGETDETTSDD